MADKLLIHDDIKLYKTADKFYLEPTIDPTDILVIDRLEGTASVLPLQAVKIPIPPSAYKPVCGFLGSIKLISGWYLVVAKYRILVGKINDQEIFQLAGTDIIPYARSTTHLTSKQIEDNNTYESMVRYALNTPGIYFSYSYDLTHSLQRLHSMGPDFQTNSLAGRADPRFLWNGHLLKNYTDAQFGRYTLPLMMGFVSINRISVMGRSMTWSLVSRRSVERAGTRYFIRGVDQMGNVANFVETEQIIETIGEKVDKSSYIQTRGSIPLFWSQYPNLKYKPAPTIAHQDHLAAFTKHLNDQQHRYGNQVLVNLIDQCGSEEMLERGFRAAVAAAAMPGVRYEPYDFHSECRGMRYDRLSVLMDRVEHEQKEFGYFLSRAGNVLKRQTGVFRTNCVDCLDRTNVVQSMLAKKQLVHVLIFLDIIEDELQIEPKNERLFRTVWADHADMISVQYSGTGALKTDFTRTGKRTKMGLVMDGINSLTRYYKNNFADGFRQDSIDLFLGNYTVSEGEGNTAICPLRRERDWKYFTLPSMLLVAVSMFAASAIAPSEYGTKTLLYIMFWGACIGAALKYMLRHGTQFVEWPRLDAGGLATRLRGTTPSL